MPRIFNLGVPRVDPLFVQLVEKDAALTLNMVNSDGKAVGTILTILPDGRLQFSYGIDRVNAKRAGIALTEAGRIAEGR